PRPRRPHRCVAGRRGAHRDGGAAGRDEGGGAHPRRDRPRGSARPRGPPPRGRARPRPVRHRPGAVGGGDPMMPTASAPQVDLLVAGPVLAPAVGAVLVLALDAMWPRRRTPAL